MKFRFCMLSVFAALMLGASALFAQELGSGVHEGQRRYLYLCSRRYHHDV